MLLHLQHNWSPNPDSYRDGVKMGIRFNSGAIPVAVKYADSAFEQNLKLLILSPLSTFGMGRLLRGTKPEDLPFIIIHSTLSGEKQGCKIARRFFIFLRFPDFKKFQK